MSSPRQTKTRLADVAEAAGVSVSTASLVFSGKGPVSSKTAQRVRAAADRLGYLGPDPTASALRQGRSGTVAVVVEDRLLYAFRDPFALAVLDGLAQELDAMGMSMLLVADHGEAVTSPAKEDGADTPDAAPSNPLAGHAVDAAVFPLCGRTDNPLVDHLLARGVPVIASGAPQNAGVTHVIVDERGATAAAAEHLIQLGHKRIGHLAMPLSPSPRTGRVRPSDIDAAPFPDARDRALGFLEVVPDGPIVEAARSDVAEGESAARLLLDVPADERPTAIVAQSDLIAVGAVRAAESLGLSVPGDVSVTGFDGVELPWFDRTLTTIDQPGEPKGRLLGTLLRQALAGEKTSDATFQVRLRVGDTTAPPA